MNLSCVICAELFGPSDDVHVTTCGHMFHLICLNQWFARSKTCPQCRCKCLAKSVHKIYFNLANLDVSRLDAGCLQSQLDDTMLKLKSTEKSLAASNKEIEELKVGQKKCKSVIVGLEKKLAEKNSLIQGQETMLRVLRGEVKLMEEQRKEIEKLKGEMELIDSIKTVMTSRLSDVEKLVKENNDANSLATLVVVLKRELVLSENKRVDLRNTLASSQQGFRKERDAKKLLEEKISELESENYLLNLRVQSNKPDGISESKATQGSENKKIRKADLNKNVETDSPLSIAKRVKLIQESTSPYLNIKSSSVGLQHLLLNKDKPQKNNVATSYLTKNKTSSTLKKTTSDLSDRYTIFKKPRLLDTVLPSKPINNLAHNGFGGVEKKSDFPLKIDLSRPSSSSNSLKISKLKKNP